MEIALIVDDQPIVAFILPLPQKHTVAVDDPRVMIGEPVGVDGKDGVHLLGDNAGPHGSLLRIGFGQFAADLVGVGDLDEGYHYVGVMDANAVKLHINGIVMVGQIVLAEGAAVRLVIVLRVFGSFIGNIGKGNRFQVGQFGAFRQ